MKIRSSTVLHKSDVGGVVLDLSGPSAVAAAARSMLDRIEGVEGFTVEAMAQRPGAFELIIGASVDPTFGPVILFGQGGIGVEVDQQFDPRLAAAGPGTRPHHDQPHACVRLLRGFRGRPPVNMDALAGALVSVSRLMLDHPEVVEFDINPILADAEGVIAVDARVKLGDPADPAAIRDRALSQRNWKPPRSCATAPKCICARSGRTTRR